MLKSLRNRIADVVRDDDTIGTEKQQQEAVRLLAEAAELEQRAKELKSRGREIAIELYEGYGLMTLAGDEGVVVIQIKKGAVTLDRKAVEELLTPAQLNACLKQGKPQTAVSFKPKTVAR